VSVKVTGEPVIFTQTVNGSEPTCSVVPPFVDTTGPGNVTGIGDAQVFPVVLTVTPVMVVGVVAFAEPTKVVP
jgi:hypothetical protein